MLVLLHRQLQLVQVLLDDGEFVALAPFPPGLQRHHRRWKVEDVTVDLHRRNQRHELVERMLQLGSLERLTLGVWLR